MNDPCLIPKPPVDKEESSILLIQDAACQIPSGQERVRTLTDNAAPPSIPLSAVQASYQDMLRMIFEADTVAVLSLSSILISGLVA